ncbi:MAG: 2-C-methyl-D-erythritol 2,4-cyclodiphosphate synthase [Bacteroidota bacterium]
MRIGQGYDLHALVPGRPLVLGGVRIPFSLGLMGHSDADVLTHAIIDALLGAAGLGDIGGHFPDTDPAYAGADSIMLLTRTLDLVRSAGWRPVNLDATLIAERPKIAPRVPEIRRRLASALRLPPEAVSVKGKTNEGLGALGRGEGIAALAVVLLAPAE